MIVCFIWILWCVDMSGDDGVTSWRIFLMAGFPVPVSVSIQVVFQYADSSASSTFYFEAQPHFSSRFKKVK